MKNSTRRIRDKQRQPPGPASAAEAPVALRIKPLFQDIHFLILIPVGTALIRSHPDERRLRNRRRAKILYVKAVQVGLCRWWKNGGSLVSALAVVRQIAMLILLRLARVTSGLKFSPPKPEVTWFRIDVIASRKNDNFQIGCDILPVWHHCWWNRKCGFHFECAFRWETKI